MTPDPDRLAQLEGEVAALLLRTQRYEIACINIASSSCASHDISALVRVIDGMKAEAQRCLDHPEAVQTGSALLDQRDTLHAELAKLKKQLQDYEDAAR